MLISLLQKRIRLDFDESDEEEMAELLADAPACSTTAAVKPCEAGDARVRRSEPVDSGTRMASPIAEDPGGVSDTPPGQMDMGQSFRWCLPLSLGYPPMMKWRQWRPLVLAGGEPESLLMLGASEDIEALLSGDSARVAGSVGPSGTTSESSMLSSKWPTENP